MHYLTASRQSVNGGVLDFLLINLGGHSLGIPLNHVRYIAPLPADFTGRDTADRHVVYDGRPLSFVSLWEELGRQSEYVEYEELLKLLPLRCQDHLDWLGALEHSIRSGSPFAKARDPRECAFGKWYYAYHPKAQRLEMMLSQFATPHAAIHALADQLLGMAEAGQRREALDALEEARSTTLVGLIQLFESVQQLLLELIRRVAVIVGDNERTCALGADGIRDIVSVDREKVTHCNGATGRVDRRSPISELVMLDGGNLVPLINWQVMCPHDHEL